MSRGQKSGGGHCSDDFLKEQFPYLKRGENGEFIIPAPKIEDFINKYRALMDSADHLERLRQYRAGGTRVKSAEIDD